MDDEKDFGFMYCGECGSAFTLDEIDDMDDVTCPECGSADVGGSDDLG